VNEKTTLALAARYLRQPSTLQGLTLLAGSVATYFGVPVEQVMAGVALFVALVLVLKDDRPAKEIIKEALDESDKS
jgi:hypothetical protein